jgi:hypothetical protein
MSHEKVTMQQLHMFLYGYCVVIKVEIVLSVFITLSKVIGFCGQGHIFLAWTQNTNAINKQK